jgi:hypothetical protein
MIRELCRKTDIDGYTTSQVLLPEKLKEKGVKRAS